MTKKHNINVSKYKNLSNLALYATIIAVLGIGIISVSHYMGRKKARREITRLNNEIYKNRDAQHTYTTTAPEFIENKRLKKSLDSLDRRNAELFMNAQEKYFNRIDVKYPMGRFFTPAQISELNKIVMPYAGKISESDTDIYNFIKKKTPITGKMTISEFESVLHLLNIPSEKFAPMDMVVDNGFLFLFNDARQQKLFESYLEDLSRTFSEFDETRPNFEIPENAQIYDEYTNNMHKISKLNKKIEDNSFLIAQTLAQFGRKNDSLNALIAKYQEKLK